MSALEREAVVNPFTVTKATDFTDSDIARTFVNLPTEGGWASVIRPSDPMPMLLLGGKGVGRTHLMRYLSLSVRTLNRDALRQVAEDRFLGIYVRAGGLNAGRFAGKGESNEKWAVIFSYYMDLWLSQMTLATLDNILATDPDRASYEPELIEGILGIFDEQTKNSPQNLHELGMLFHERQRSVDLEVNNIVLLPGSLEPRIAATRGRLVFGIPQVAIANVPALRDVQFLYLLDELENLEAEQQRYVNTLIREREAPVSFRVGARLYGIRTFGTYSAGEENREGSEYEAVRLDSLYRSKPRLYADFCRSIVARRLDPSVRGDEKATKGLGRSVDELFYAFPNSAHSVAETQFMVDHYEPEERPYLVALRRKLRESVSLGLQPEQVGQLVDYLRVPDIPLLEKANTFLLYRSWSRGEDVRQAALQIRERCAEYQGNRRSAYGRVLGHFGEDLVAQMLREARQPQRYLGFNSFVVMSSSLPRNLMIILKHVYAWAIFNDEEPFRRPISAEAQQRGVLEAARWFYDNAQVLGDRGPEIHDCVRRLGNFLSVMRFSDKPVESSLVSFSIDLDAVSSRARENLDLARQWSLLIRFENGQRDRNAPRVDAKFQLSGMLAPLWELPLARRGVTPMSPEECDAIFDPQAADDYDEIVTQRLRRMNAPFRDPEQHAFPGL
jgi:hypothetical protein